MNYPVFYTARAKMDVETASFWYERQRKGLGLEFLNCVENSLAKIQRYPESYPKIRQELRRVLLKRFPYSLFYLFKKNCVYVVSVFDNRQDPRKLP